MRAAFLHASLLCILALTAGGCAPPPTIPVSTLDQPPPTEPKPAQEAGGGEEGLVLAKEEVLHERGQSPELKSSAMLSPSDFDRRMASHGYPLQYTDLIQATDRTLTEYTETDNKGFRRIYTFRILGEPKPHYFQAVARRFDPHSHPL